MKSVYAFIYIKHLGVKCPTKEGDAVVLPVDGHTIGCFLWYTPSRMDKEVFTYCRDNPTTVVSSCQT